jgi:hypothetical protein
MALPKIVHPVFTLIVPSTKEKVTFRPFLVKEEKLLLMAKQGQDKNDIGNVLKQIINNCDVESKLDVNKLASFDIEYLFLKIRAKTVNNLIDLAYTDIEDDEVYKFQIDLDDVEITYTEGHTNVIKLSETSGLVMKYPSIDTMDLFFSGEEVDNILFYLIKNCIKTYYEDDKVIEFSDCKKEEVDEFVDNLPTSVITDFDKFFDSMPKLYHKLEYTNKKGTERIIELRTLEDFFTLR